MTPTQIARRSDALYADGTCGMTRRMLCDMVAQRESDLEDVMAENERLRERIDAAHMSRLLTENENESLRELVRWMYDRMDESCAVQHPYAPSPISYDLLMQALARVRELGIEVDA